MTAWMTLFRRGLLCIVALAVAGAVAHGAYADGVQSPDCDVLMTVNGVADTNERDDVLTLREALQLHAGDLDAQSLSPAEARQVLVVGEMGWDGVVRIAFDPAVFCSACPGSAIRLVPPGLGEPDNAPPDNWTVALPPGLGEPDSGSTVVDPHRIGMPPPDGGAVSAHVVIDGSLLPPDATGLRLTGCVTLRGLHFQNFTGIAIEVTAEAADCVHIASGTDGVNSAEEAVTFSNNGADVVYLPIP